ncbi:dihydroorotate dehydrogenase electron transfer subunit [bacterium]|nr:MAG: dihydroorotate dehydrogenase electron transfer subunit [bacterium]
MNTALTQAIIGANWQVADQLWRLRLEVPVWTGGEPEPGQFIMLRVGDGYDPLLARPFGIAGFWKLGDGASFEILYRVVGRGTHTMTGWPAGRGVRFLGPLGNGFPVPPVKSQSLLVAGGVGLPPLLALARRMRALGREKELMLLYGETTNDRLLDLSIEQDLSVNYQTCTEDGSCGMKGLVTELLAERKHGARHHLYVCGPNPMMKAVHNMSEEKCITSHYSLESRMACGFGVCSGCAVNTGSGPDSNYVRVCCEGPVFPGRVLTEESFRETV